MQSNKFGAWNEYELFEAQVKMHFADEKTKVEHIFPDKYITFVFVKLKP